MNGTTKSMEVGHERYYQEEGAGHEWYYQEEGGRS